MAFILIWHVVETGTGAEGRFSTPVQHSLSLASVPEMTSLDRIIGMTIKANWNRTKKNHTF